MKSQIKKIKNLKSISILLFVALVIFTTSCKKEKLKADEQWQFTKLVNATLDNDGYMVTLDFYQKKGTEWRIVQMSPDDYTKFNLEKIITPNAYELPVDNANAFLTSNIRLFNPVDDKVYNQGNLKWPLGEPVEFKTFNTYNNEFPDMPAAYNKLSKFSAATYSLEQTYDNNSKSNTYIFYDFPNQKYLYYGFRTGADLILENTLPLLCTTCNSISWKDIDAVTCTGKNDNTDLYYFFDFDAKQMFILDRIDKNTNHSSFQINNTPISFGDAFFNEFGSNGGNELPFDFSK